MKPAELLLDRLLDPATKLLLSRPWTAAARALGKRCRFTCIVMSREKAVSPAFFDAISTSHNIN